MELYYGEQNPIIEAMLTIVDTEGEIVVETTSPFTNPIKHQVLVFPNPAYDRGQIARSPASGKPIGFMLANTLGEIIKTGSTTTFGNGTISLDNLPIDIYFLQFAHQSYATQRIIVQR